MLGYFFATNGNRLFYCISIPFVICMKMRKDVIEAFDSEESYDQALEDPTDAQRIDEGNKWMGLTDLARPCMLPLLGKKPCIFAQKHSDKYSDCAQPYYENERGYCDSPSTVRHPCVDGRVVREERLSFSSGTSEHGVSC